MHHGLSCRGCIHQPSWDMVDGCSYATPPTLAAQISCTRQATKGAYLHKGSQGKVGFGRDSPTPATQSFSNRQATKGGYLHQGPEGKVGLSVLNGSIPHLPHDRAGIHELEVILPGHRWPGGHLTRQGQRSCTDACMCGSRRAAASKRKRMAMQSA